MPVSGIVLALDSQNPAMNDSLKKLEAHPDITLGQAVEQRLPIALSTEDSKQDQEVWAWLNNLNGIEKVDVVYIAFDSDV